LSVIEEEQRFPSMLNQNSVETVETGSFRRQLVEFGPLVWVLVSLWLKLGYFSLSLRASESLRGTNLTPEESIWRWFHTHPDIFSATPASLLLLLALAPLAPRVWRFCLLLALNLVLTTVILADLAHMRFYEAPISVLEVSRIFMLPTVAASIYNLLRPTDALLYLDVILGILAAPFYLRASRRFPRTGRKVMWPLSVRMLLAGLLLAIPSVWIASQDRNGVFAYKNLQRDVCAVIGLFPFHISEILLHLGTHKPSIEKPEGQRVLHFYENRDQTKEAPSNFFGVARGRNLIVLSAESLEAFPIGLEIHGQPITPRLNSFAKECLYFSNYYHQAYIGRTSDAEFEIMQSLHNLPNGPVSTERPRSHFHALPAILSAHGYTTLSATGESGIVWNMNLVHPAYGFQQSYFDNSYQMVERIGLGLSDEEFFAQTLPILKAQTNPFMAFLLSSSSHHPFKVPEKYHVLKLGELEGTTLGDYLHSIHYFDQAFGDFIDQLRETGLLDKAVLAVYGDHNAFLGNTSDIAHLLSFPEQSEYRQWQLAKKVPLFIRLPYGEGAGVKTNTGCHLDVAPTLLSLLGIPDEHDVMLGNDLTRGRNSLVVFRDGSFADGTHYFINHFGPASSSNCYETATGKPFDCRLLEGERREAINQLEISDTIIYGDLIPALRNRLEGPNGRERGAGGEDERPRSEE